MHVLAALAAFAAMAVPAQGQVGPGTDGLAIWRSTSGSLDRIALEASTLLLSLDAYGALPTDDVVDPVGRTVEQIMREESRFVGTYFPRELDLLLCRLNTHVCRPANGSVPAIWRNIAGDTLNLPALTFREYLEFGTVQKPVGVAPLELVGAFDDCDRFGATCEDILYRLNGHNPAVLEPAVAGPVIVPKNGYQTEIDWQILTSGVQPDSGSGWVLDNLPDLVGRNIVAIGSGAPQAFIGEPAYEGQSELFGLIDFPFREVAEMDEVPAQFREPVRIAVVDTWLDGEHCELAATTRAQPVEDSHMARRGDDHRFDCGSVADMTNVVSDHGTHIVGQISAPIDGRGIAGLNPFADVIFHEVDLQRLRNAKYREDLGLALVRVRTAHDAAVFNISWQYSNDQGSRDTLQMLITESLASALFVAAAGNNRRAFRHGACDVLPACFAASPNVITVVGFDRVADYPSLWQAGAQGSNSSGDFHVGAIAADVVSTTSQNRYGSMSGTSQATPQVTATAAYVVSAYRHFYGHAPAPIRTKNRIIYTSDIFPRLLDAAVGGRLNMRRALQVEHDHLIVRLGGGTTALEGKLVSLGGRDSEDDIIICRNPDTMADEHVSLRDLRRFVLQPLSRTYVIFANSVRGDRHSAVRRIAGCDLRTKSRIAQFVTREGHQHGFPIEQIEDFVSSMN